MQISVHHIRRCVSKSVGRWCHPAGFLHCGRRLGILVLLGMAVYKTACFQVSALVVGGLNGRINMLRPQPGYRLRRVLSDRMRWRLFQVRYLPKEG